MGDRDEAKVGPEGIELYPQNPGKKGFPKIGAAESGAVDAWELSNDSGLAEIVEAWQALPIPIKAGIVAMVRAAGDQPG